MAIKSRRKAREAALRGLYELEIGQEPVQVVLAKSLVEADLTPELKAFATQLIRGVYSDHAEIDGILQTAIKDWDLDRVAMVDRNVLRIAVYELYHCPHVPPAVTINEAIEIGKKYSTAESGKFINGVLGNVVKQSPKAEWKPTEEAPEEAAPDEPTEPEPEEETLDADSDEAKRLLKSGGWKIRSEGEKN